MNNLINLQNTEQVIATYISSLNSPLTQASYDHNIKMFQKYFESRAQKDILDIKSQADLQNLMTHINTYKLYLSRKYKESTVNVRLNAIKGLYKYAHSCMIIPINPVASVKSKRVYTHRETEHLTKEQVRAILSHAGHGLERITLYLLAYTGARKEEIRNIQWRDFTYDQEKNLILTIIGKGNKKRNIVLNEKCVVELKQYKTLLSDEGITLRPEHYVLKQWNRHERKVGSTYIWEVVKSACARAGIVGRISPHSFRASLITHLLSDELVPIRDVALMAGHASTVTTERYDKSKSETLYRVASAISY
jgi:integrase/recombinase XerD